MSVPAVFVRMGRQQGLRVADFLDAGLGIQYGPVFDETVCVVKGYDSGIVDDHGDGFFVVADE
jgi:hypothetical protein